MLNIYVLLTELHPQSGIAIVHCWIDLTSHLAHHGFYFCFEMKSYYVALADLELTLYTRLASLCLPRTRIKNVHHFA